MADQFTDFLRVLDAFDKNKVEYILIGGVAMVLHGMERLTRDIDIFVKMDAANIKLLRKSLKSVFEDDSIEEITLEELSEYAVVRYGTPNGFNIDILGRIGEMFCFEDLEYEIINHEGTNIRVATPATLYKLKKNSLRDRDKMDAMFLKEILEIRKSKKSE